MNNGIQAIKDAGIVVVVILLLVSVRFTPRAETGQELGNASLTPQTQAAPAPAPVEVNLPAAPVNAAVISTPDKFSINEWVLNDSDEISHSIDLDAAAVEHCSEVLIHIRKAVEKTRNKAIVLGTEEVIKVLPCSA
jgi:hypothetical protein